MIRTSTRALFAGRRSPKAGAPHFQVEGNMSADSLETLAAEARQLGHRRAVVEAAATRARAQGAIVADRLAGRSARLHQRFHKAIDRLWEVGGLPEALAAFRDDRTELDDRLAR